MKNISHKISILKKILGVRVTRWLIIGSITAFCVGYVEFLVTIALQLFLKKLDIIGNEIQLPVIFNTADLSIVWIFVFFVIIIIARMFLQLISSLSAGMSHVLIAAKLRIGIYYALLQKRNPKFISAADINFQINEIAQKSASFCNQSVSIFNFSIQAITLAVIMLLLTWELTVVGLSLLAVLGMALVQINRPIHHIAQELPKEIYTISRGIQRTTRNWLLVQILRTNNLEYEKLVNCELRYRYLDIRILLLTFLSNALPQTLGMLLVVGIIFLNIKFFHVESAIFLSFLYLFLRFVQNISNISQKFGKTISFYPQFKIAVKGFQKLSNEDVCASSHPTKLISIFNPNPHYINKSILEHSNLTEIGSSPNISIQNLSFTYEKDLMPVLSNLSLEIKAGSQIGIIGKSGSGKTTLLGLILGLLTPTGGKVLLNGEESSEFYSKNKIKIGYVGPEPFLIEGSIKDNLTYGHFQEKDISDGQYYEALELARMKEHIDSLPKGMEFKILENGDGLSAGQKQRLAFARAILIMPKLLILDEVSANLDSETELEIAKSIKNLKGKCTIIIISHKPGILKYADEVFDLERLKMNTIEECLK